MKPWYQSMTLRMNGLVIVAALATKALAVLPPSSNSAMWLSVAIAAANAAIRFKTDSGLTLT